MKWFDWILAAAFGTIMALMAVRAVKAEETLSEISVRSASYCALYSREMVFIEMMHGREVVTADTDYILKLAQAHYGDCLAVLPALLPLPPEGSLRSWLADMRDLLVLTGKERVIDVGTEPAKENPKDDEWRRQCRAEYSTWEEATGTVIRKGNPERVKCPCGGEVQCGY